MRRNQSLTFVILSLFLALTACALPPLFVEGEPTEGSPGGSEPAATEPSPTAAAASPTPADSGEPTEEPQPASTACGTDAECFYQAAENCQQAEYLQGTTLDFMGMEVQTRTRFVIQGQEEQVCVFQVVTEEVQVGISEEAHEQLVEGGYSEEEIQNQLETVRDQQLEAGFDETCRGQGSDLAAMIERWEAGQLSSEDWGPFQCQGKIFSAASVPASTPTSASPDSVRADNLLQNPSFEVDPREAELRWDSSSGDAGIQASWSTASAYQGEYALALAGTKMGASGFPDWYTKDLLSINAGEPYDFSVWLMSPEGASGLISVDLLNVEGQYILGHAVGCVELPPGEWQEVAAEVSGEETSEASYVRFHLRLCLPEEGEELQQIFFDQFYFGPAVP